MKLNFQQKITQEKNNKEIKQVSKVVKNETGLVAYTCNPCILQVQGVEELKKT